MYRRNVLFERKGALKVVLLAAACALSVGYIAEKRLATQREDATTVAGESVETVRPLPNVRVAS